MKKKITPWLTVNYGAIIIVFGCIGYQKAGSFSSLLSGLFFGGVVIGSACVLFADRKEGLYSALGATAFLTVVFIYRYIVTGKNLSAFLAGLSAVVFLLLLSNFKDYFPSCRRRDARRK